MHQRLNEDVSGEL